MTSIFRGERVLTVDFIDRMEALESILEKDLKESHWMCHLSLKQQINWS